MDSTLRKMKKKWCAAKDVNTLYNQIRKKGKIGLKKNRRLSCFMNEINEQGWRAKKWVYGCLFDVYPGQTGFFLFFKTPNSFSGPEKNCKKKQKIMKLFCLY